jgi:ATP-dependent Clp protease ATP-binding subunit ClpX
MENEDNEELYGILMKRIELQDGIYLLNPIRIVKGKTICYDENGEEVSEKDADLRLFVDDLGNNYSLLRDTVGDPEEMEVIGAAADINKIKENYPDDDPLDVISDMFNNICNEVQLAIYVESADQVINFPLNLVEVQGLLEATNPSKDKKFIMPDKETIMQPLFNTHITTEENMLDIPDPDELEPDESAQIDSAIGIEINSFKKLLEINNYEELHKSLLVFFEAYKKYREALLPEENIEEGSNTLAEELEVKQLATIAPKEDKAKTVEKPQEEKINIHQMKEYFDKRIIGQEAAKRDVILSVMMNRVNEDSKNKSTCLLIGPTGSGKTLIAETVGEYFDIPVQTIDTTQLTIPGYIGADIDDFLVDLLEKANGDLNKAEHGVVILDELDKKGSDSNGDISGKGVLNTLLPFIQGTTYNIKYHLKIVPFNTSNLTIFGTGAFTDVAQNKNKDIINKCYSNTSIGFNSNVIKSDNTQDIKYPKITGDDLVKYGKMPVELIGRFTTITQLSGHTKESLRTILTNSDISPLLSLEKKLDKLGIDLTYTDGYLDAVAEKALEKKSGARSLKKVIEETTNPSIWTATYNDSYYRIILNKDTVKDPLNSILVGLDDVEYSVREVLNQSESKKEEKQMVRTLTKEENSL